MGGCLIITVASGSEGEGSLNAVLRCEKGSWGAPEATSKLQRGLLNELDGKRR